MLRGGSHNSFMVKIDLSKGVYILIKNGLPVKVDTTTMPETLSFIQNGRFVPCQF